MKYPLEGNYYVTVGFNGMASYGPHEGVDLNLPGNDCGTLLRLIADGEIVYSMASNKDYGDLTVVKIDGPWGTRYVRYCHQQERRLTSGFGVEGDVVGLMGTTGNSTGCHLHFDILKEKPITWRFYSKDVLRYFEDPLGFIQKWSTVVVPPTPPAANTITQEQYIIDTYSALTGEFPNDDEKKWRLQQNLNLRDLITDICSGDSRFKEKWGNTNQDQLQAEIATLQGKISAAMEVLK